MKFLLILALPLLALTSCKSFESQTTPETVELVRSELGGLSNTTEWGKFYMGGQPSEADLALAAKRGVTRVINLRTYAEVEGMSFSEASVCSELGLEYIQVPVNWDILTDEKFDFLLETIKKDVAGKTLFHCASGNRCSVFVAAFRVIDGGVPYEVALADARAAGMKPSSKVVLDAQLLRLTVSDPE
jgi:uncharacterized protein (TIGR01244 family)